jgi:cell division protein FtsW
MVYSSSYIYSKEVIGTSTHFLFKQCISVIIGALLGFIVSKTKAGFWYKNIYVINAIAITLLILTFTPLGVSVKGSQRWLSLMGLTLQPGEFIKYTVLISAVRFFDLFDKYDYKSNLVYAMNFIAPLSLLIMQPDFGTFTICAVIIAFACFISNFSRKIFVSSVVVGAIGLYGILISAPYRVKRLLTFLDPWSDPQNSGFQIIQSYLAFANGHIFGQGIGNSNEKLFYLPEAYNDFILSVLGEELGFVGVLFIVCLYVVFIYLGFKLALTIKSKISAQIIASLIFCIGLQAFLNMGVVLGLLPTKGLNLPFISYGGSSIIANLIAVGFIFSLLHDKSQIDDTPKYTNSGFQAY